MSVQFGIWNFEGQLPAADYIEKVSATLAPYGPDSNESYSKDGVRILYRAFHTTKESRRESQPYISPSGTVITWDGRLDNRADLISELPDSATVNSTDVSIVAAAFEKWGPNCLGKLIGDWALSIWNPRERSVLLAKDPIGTKHLYYAFDDLQLTWSTILDPLVLFTGKTFEICEEYIAGWFSLYPATHLTPYVGIRSVSPSSSVLLQNGKHIVSKYWDFDPGRRIRYRTDSEYEEHFRSVLAQAVERTLRSDRPVLAELSGGLDSSSIICIADVVFARGRADCPRLDTISWYDDSYDHLEPDSNELHWITKIEEKRGRTGHHINVAESEAKRLGSQEPFASECEKDYFAAIPVASLRRSECFHRYAGYMKSQGYRVVLSGIGGSEFMGDGVPTPHQELQDLLARARFFAFARQLKAWAIKMKKPRLHLLWEAIGGFYSRVGLHEQTRAAHWLHGAFIRRNHAALCGYPFRVKLFGPLPSFQDNIGTLKYLQRVFACRGPQTEWLYDKRYPFLDRSLLEFMYAIPREQVVGVGQRRFLMKRALVGIVPDELLKRRRKGFAAPKSLNDRATELRILAETEQCMVSGSLGIVDPDRFLKAVHKARRNQEDRTDFLVLTLMLESWLRHLVGHKVLASCISTKRKEAVWSPDANGLEAPSQLKSSAG